MPPPDSDLHPVATGLAKQTVDKHSSKQPLVLFVQRAWTVLEEKGIPYQYVEVNPYHKPESLMKLNPRGLVPTLQYHDKPLYESTVLCEFLEDAFPDRGPKLLPTDPYSRAVIRIWIDFVTSRVIPSFQRFLQHQSNQSQSSLDDVRSDYHDKLLQLADVMDKDGPFFMGKEPALVDFVMAPFAARSWVFDQFKGGFGAPAEGEGGTREKSWARWRKWLSAITDRKSIKETTSEREHYLPIYKRYAENTAESELAKATREGKVVP